MKYLQRSLAGLLVLCLVVRIGSWLVAPAIPGIVVLLLVVGIVQLMLYGRSH